MTERERRMRWIAACRLDSLNVTRHTRICSAHFKGGLGPTKSNPVPTIFDFPKHLQPKTHKSRTNPDERRHRNAKPELKKEINMEQSASSKQDVRVEGMDLSSDKNNCTFEGNRNPDCQPVYVDAEVQTDLTTSDIQFMDECKARLENKTRLKRDLFIEDPFAEKMKYWDGKKKTAREAYQEEKDRKKPGPKRQVPLFAEFILVMDILFAWPTMQQVRRHLPKSFEKFPQTRVIIDCTEIKIQKPTGPSAQKVTWSNYKSSNTFKLLVGISPTGAFTFVSKLWSGGVSDRHITMKSGLIDKLEPNDDCMADRGFNIRDLVTNKRATLNIPPFSKGKQLSTKACTKTRRIAAVRIHVERAIQRLKGFKILQGVLPISLASVADQTVTVCAALCNLMKPLVK
ncbi:uncharacterized protein [Montipora capricornis]|uniref:uncharacterized protein n=1 Tax=Montipora capricornis TaxID=246305 RepID=UPI0035F119DA